MFNRDRFSTSSGLRMLDQPFMTDLIEANAMGHVPNDIDIYSASWGPTDDGKTVDGPRNMTMRAIVKGVNEVLTTTLKTIHCSKQNCVLRKFSQNAFNSLKTKNILLDLGLQGGSTLK